MRKAIIIFLLIVLSAMPAMAERYIVLNESNVVLYKGDTATLPELKAGEWIILAPNINDIQKNARWDGNVFINPLPALEPEQLQAIKSNYTQSVNEMETILTAVTMTENQQTGAIKQEARSILNMMRFLKFVFWGN